MSVGGLSPSPVSAPPPSSLRSVEPSSVDAPDEEPFDEEPLSTSVVLTARLPELGSLVPPHAAPMTMAADPMPNPA
jgi:hypothetical protein